MDIEKIRRIRTIKVLIVDLIMTISVVVIVAILVAAVAGWRINSDFTVEQNGLVSIKTRPTGASVNIDDSEQFQTSNMSKMLTGGEHKIVIQKEGYESWEKTITVTPGWLYRLEYPRLFKQDREKEELRTYVNLNFFYVSPDRSAAIYAEENTTEWTLVTNFNGNLKYENINIQGLFTNTENGEFKYKIKHLEWNENNERILVNVSNDKLDEWGIISLNTAQKSINISNDFSDLKDISDVKFEDSSGKGVLALAENKIIRLDLNSKSMTKIIDDVESFNFRDNEIIYLENKSDGRKIKLYHIGDEKAVDVSDIDNDKTVSLALTKFNSQNYLLYTNNNRIFVYRAADYPRSGSNFNMSLINENDLGIIPTEVVVSKNNEFIVFREGSRVVVYDAELEIWNEYDYGDEKVRFLDDFLLYRVDSASKKFLTWDFDSSNVRTLVVDCGNNSFDALISENERYFYYIGSFSEGETTYYKLIREKLQ